MRTKLISVFILLFICTSAFAVKVDTVKTYSNSMQKEIPAVIILPDNYSKNKSYPVVYLLHGYSGSYRADWATDAWGTKRFADIFDMIFVAPDGGFSSWYFDSSVDPAWRYETYISKELVEFVDKNYSTINSPKGRAITGLSMGGHGALYLAFRNQNVFGACGSMSGGVDIRPFPNNWEIAKRLGTYAENPENWEKNTIVNMTHLLTPKALAIIIDCGTDDFFYEVNCKLHEKLKYNNIPHDFISRPGAHNAEYWKNAVKYQLMFFNDFFLNTN